MNHSGEFVLVYTTLPDEEAARTIAVHLIDRHLAACCNILPPMRSVYRWENEIQSEPETAMLIKTRRTLADAVIDAARPLHPHAVPCFMTLPIDSIDGPYRNWAMSQTQDPE